MSDSPKSVGLIGNSLAGNAITERLVRAGCRVYSFDMAGCGMQPMLRLGAVCVDSPIALAAATSRIILSDRKSVV